MARDVGVATLDENAGGRVLPADDVAPSEKFQDGALDGLLNLHWEQAYVALTRCQSTQWPIY